MHRLFWKIFAWFWTAMVALLLVMVSLEWFVPLEPPGISHQALLRLALETEAERATVALKKGGATALNQELEAFENRTGVQAFWLDGTGREPPETSLTAPVVSPIIEEMARQAMQNPLPSEALWRAAGLSVYSGVAAPTSNRVLVVRLDRSLPPSRFSSRVLRVVVTLVTASIVCWLLARHLVRPIEALRGASKRLAAGDLTARVSPALPARRRDEIALLSRDFDLMAGQLQTLMDAQKRLIGDVSHELRTPLTRLRLALALLSRDTPAGFAAPMQGHRERMESEIAALDSLINELLLLSRLENRLERRETPLATPPFDALACLREVAQKIGWEAQQRPDKVAVRVEIDPEIATAPVAGEAALLRRALENIGRNALCYSPPGGTITFALSRGDSCWQINISDDGPGVPQAELEAIFRPFYRVELARDREHDRNISSTDQNPAGTGLGLAIARRAIESHGGTLRASNRQPRGLKMAIELPIEFPAPAGKRQGPDGRAGGVHEENTDDLRRLET